MERTADFNPASRTPAATDADASVDSRAVVRERSLSIPVALLCVYVFVEYGRPDFLMKFSPGLIIVLLLSVLLLKNARTAKSVVKDRFFVLFAVLLLEMIIHGPIATNNYWAFESFLSMFSLFLYSLSIAVFIDTAGKLRIFLTSLVAVHLIAASRYLPLDLNMGYSGIMGETNDFAMAMTVVTPIAFCMGLSSKGVKRVAFFAATLIFVYANVSAVSRGGFLGMAAILLLGVFLSRSKAKAVVLAAIGVLIFVVVMPANYRKQVDSIVIEFGNTMSWLQSGEVTNTVDPDDPKSGTGIDRVELWRVGLRVFAGNPVIGVGQGNLPWVIENYQDYERDLWGRGIGGRVVHSLYVTVLAELGVVGMALFVLMVADLVSKYRRVAKMRRGPARRPKTGDETALSFLEFEMKGLVAAVTGFLVAAIFLTVFGYPQFWHLGGLMVGMSLIAGRTRSVQITDQI